MWLGNEFCETDGENLTICFFVFFFHPASGKSMDISHNHNLSVFCMFQFSDLVMKDLTHVFYLDSKTLRSFSRVFLAVPGSGGKA